MRKFLKVVKFIIVGALMVIPFTCLAYHLYYRQLDWHDGVFEKICYGIWFVGVAMFFYEIADKFKRVWSKIVAAVSTSLIYTGLVIAGNTLLKYICINNWFGWIDPIPYDAILKSDITLTYAWAWVRYPAVFLLMLVVCALKAFDKLWVFGVLFYDLCEKVENWLYLKDLKKQGLLMLYYDCVEDPEHTPFKKLYDYILNMPLEPKWKDVLKMFITLKKAGFLIPLLLKRYENMLTKDEYNEFKQLYIEYTEAYLEQKREYYANAKVEFNEVFDRLDEKFDTANKQ